MTQWRLFDKVQQADEESRNKRWYTPLYFKRLDDSPESLFTDDVCVVKAYHSMFSLPLQHDVALRTGHNWVPLGVEETKDYESEATWKYRIITWFDPDVYEKYGLEQLDTDPICFKADPYPNGEMERYGEWKIPLVATHDVTLPKGTELARFLLCHNTRPLVAIYNPDYRPLEGGFGE